MTGRMARNKGARGAAGVRDGEEHYQVRRLLISFSGGRTSAYMTKRILDARRANVEYLVVFANTGQEHERTLAFVDRCDREWNLGVVWVEAVTHEGRVGCTHKRVTFETASRDGAPFEAVIAKYGIPNKTYPHCNRELKLAPIHDFAESYGWEPGSYDTAIGIRADEADRQNVNAKKLRLTYPLIKFGAKKPEILGWWRRQPFDLYVPEHMGNCVWCWKKSLRKQLTLAKQTPEAFDFPARMEAQYPFNGANGDGQPRRFFRQHWTTLDLKAKAAKPFAPFRDGNHVRDPELDDTDGCDEACDIYAPDLIDLMGQAA